MESKHRELFVGLDHNRRHRALETLRLIDRDVRDLVVLQELDRSLGVLLVEPAPVPELHRDGQVETLPGLEDELTCLVRRKHPFRELDEDRAQLSCLDQRLERFAELHVHRVEQLGRHVLAIDALLFRQLAAQLLSNRFGQPSHLRWLTRHQCVRFDVEDEGPWCALDPRLRGLLVGQRVVRRVDLDDRELARVEAQALLCRARAFRIEDSWRRHRRVGPARGAETRLAFADLDRCSPGVAAHFSPPASDLYTRIMRIGLGHPSYANHSVTNLVFKCQHRRV